MSVRDCGNCKHYADDWAGTSNPSGYGNCQRVMPHTRTNDGNICGLHEYALATDLIDPHDAARAALMEAVALVQKIAGGYDKGGDKAIACGLYITSGSILALANDPAALAEIVKGVKG